MATPRLEHQTVKVRDLVNDYRSGRLVIPEFQRDYVWRKSKAPRLIDSLYQGFPVSSFLVWQSAQGARARHKASAGARGAVVNWLIDGQQRLITLARTLDGDEDIHVMFNVTRNEFLLANAATRNDPNCIPLCNILDDELYRQLRRNFDAVHIAEKQESRLERVRAILQYEIPVVRMVDHSFDDAVHAFERINTLGVKLKREDIESAHIAARHSGFIADHVAPFLQTLRDDGFNRLNIMHLFRACAFVACPDGRNRTPLHQLSETEVLGAWKITKRATEMAIHLIRSEMGLINMDILWSGALVVPIIVLCAITPAAERDPKALIGWLALAALRHRYSGSSDTALDQDLRACRTADPIGALLRGRFTAALPSLEAVNHQVNHCKVYMSFTAGCLGFIIFA